MILFEFSCKECSIHFEELAAKDEKIFCPNCKSLAEKDLTSNNTAYSSKERERTNYINGVRAKVLGKCAWRKHSDEQG